MEIFAPDSVAMDGAASSLVSLAVNSAWVARVTGHIFLTTGLFVGSKTAE